MSRLDVLRARIPKVWRDIAARAVWTFLQVFAAVLVASGLGKAGVDNWAIVTKASAAGLVACLSALKSIATSHLGISGQVATR